MRVEYWAGEVSVWVSSPVGDDGRVVPSTIRPRAGYPWLRDIDTALWAPTVNTSHVLRRKQQKATLADLSRKRISYKDVGKPTETEVGRWLPGAGGMERGGSCLMGTEFYRMQRALGGGW